MTSIIAVINHIVASLFIPLFVVPFPGRPRTGIPRIKLVVGVAKPTTHIRIILTLMIIGAINWLTLGIFLLVMILRTMALMLMLILALWRIHQTLQTLIKTAQNIILRLALMNFPSIWKTRFIAIGAVNFIVVLVNIVLLLRRSLYFLIFVLLLLLDLKLRSKLLLLLILLRIVVNDVALSWIIKHFWLAISV